MEYIKKCMNVFKNHKEKEWGKEKITVRPGLYNAEFPPFITKNFYISAGECPSCGLPLYKTVFPVGQEYPILVKGGYKIGLKRVFTCSKCTSFLSAELGKKLMDGSIYIIKYDSSEYKEKLLDMDRKGTTEGRPDL